MNFELIVLSVSILQIVIVTRIEGRQGVYDLSNSNLYFEGNIWVLEDIPNNHDGFELRCFSKRKADNCTRCLHHTTRASTTLEYAVCVFVIVAFIANLICFYRNMNRTKYIVKQIENLNLGGMKECQIPKYQRNVAMVSNDHLNVEENIDSEKV